MPANKETLRQAIVSCLQDAQRPLSFKDLSVMLGVSEKDLPAHLEHVGKSLRSHGKKLSIIPATCRTCGFVFDKRKRLTEPSRCPDCRSERIDPPMFTVE